MGRTAKTNTMVDSLTGMRIVWTKKRHSQEKVVSELSKSQSFGKRMQSQDTQPKITNAGSLASAQAFAMPLRSARIGSKADSAPEKPRTSRC